MIKVIIHKSQTFEAKNERKQKQKLTSLIRGFIILMLSVIFIGYSLQTLSIFDVGAHLRGIESCCCGQAETSQSEMYRVLANGTGESKRYSFQNGWTYRGTAYVAEGGVIEGNGTWDDHAGLGYIGDWYLQNEEDTMWKKGKRPGVCGRGSYFYLLDPTRSYNGQWMDDAQNGQGIEVLTGQYVYEGHWSGGKKNGHGKLFQHSIGKKKKLLWSGTWVDNISQRGLDKKQFIVTEHGYYQGRLNAEGQREGNGVMHWTHGRCAGDTYNGEWKQDKMEGKGVYTFAGGKEKYDGQFVNGKQEGYGKYTYPNGDTYEGYYVDGKEHGRGKYHWKAQKITYDGDWANGKKEGQGSILDEDGYIKSHGQWTNDVQATRSGSSWAMTEEPESTQ